MSFKGYEMGNVTIYDEEGFPVMTVDTQTTKIDREILVVSTEMRDAGLRFRMKGDIPVVYNKRDQDNTVPVTFLLRDGNMWTAKYSKSLVSKAIVYKFRDVKSVMNRVREYIIAYKARNA